MIRYATGPFRFIAVVVIFLASQWASAFALQSPTQIVEGWMKGAEGYSFMSVTHSGISHDPASGETTVSNLVLSFHFESTSKKSDTVKFNYILNFGNVHFFNLAADASYYSASAIKTGTIKFDIKMRMPTGADASSDSSGSISGIEINNMRWSRLPAIADDPARPISRYYPLVAALVDYSFDRAVIGSLVTRQVMPGNLLTIETTYGQTTYGKTVRGDTAGYVMTGMRVRSTAPASGKDAPSSGGAANAELFDFSIASLKGSHLNYGALVRNFAPGVAATAGPDSPYKTIAGDMSLNGLTGTFPDGSVKLASLVIADWGIRPSRVALLELADKLYLQGVATGKEPDPQDIIKIVSATYGSMRLGVYEMTGLKVVAKDGYGGMEKFRIADLSSAGLAEFTAAGLLVNARDGTKLRLGSYSLLKIGFPSLAAIIGFEANQKAGNVPEMLKAIPTLGQEIIADFYANVPGAGEFSLASSMLTMAGFIGPIPTSIDLKFDNFKMPVSVMESEPREVFKAMGFSDVEASFHLKLGWQESQKILSLVMNGNMVNAGAFKMAAQFGSVPRSVFENPLTGARSLTYATINSAKFTFTDQSIVGRVLKFGADEQKTDPVTFRQQIVGAIPFGLKILNKPQFTEKVIAAVKRFLDTKGSIAAEVNPPTPVSVLQIIAGASTAPGSIIDVLNVTVTAK